jgi:branched-chain amino acid transport system permease protein
MKARSLFQSVPTRTPFTRLRVLGGGVLVTLGLLVPVTGSNYLMTVFSIAYFYVVLSESWNLISGYTGYLSFGHSMFIGVGAFTTFVLFDGYGVPWVVALLVAGVLAATLAVVIGIPSLRIKGVYFAIAMLVLNEVLKLLAEGPLEFLTNGPRGLTVFSGPDVRTVYFSLGALAVVTVLVSTYVVNSKIGLHMEAVREREVVAESMGVDTTRTKLFAFAVSAFFPAMAGGLYAFTITYIDPSVVFDLRFTLEMTVMTIIGGIGTISGPLAGALVFGVLSEVLILSAPELFQILLGSFLIAVVLFSPGGLHGIATGPRVRGVVDRLRTRLPRRLPDYPPR